MLRARRRCVIRMHCTCVLVLRTPTGGMRRISATGGIKGWLKALNFGEWTLEWRKKGMTITHGESHGYGKLLIRKHGFIRILMFRTVVNPSNSSIHSTRSFSNCTIHPVIIISINYPCLINFRNLHHGCTRAFLTASLGCLLGQVFTVHTIWLGTSDVLNWHNKTSFL